MGSDVDLSEATHMNMNFASSADLFKKKKLTSAVLKRNFPSL